MSALEESSVIGRALDACGRKLDGSAASAQYYWRRRRVFYAALKYAVREGRLSANPLDRVGLDREWKAPEVEQAIDRRRVASPTGTASRATTSAGTSGWRNTLASLESVPARRGP
jgi:hypothetical protein